MSVKGERSYERYFCETLGHIADAARANSPYMFATGTVGLDVRLINNQAIVTRVISNSPAFEAGIKRGFRLLSLDGESIAQIFQNTHQRPPFTPTNRQYFRTEAVLWHLFGKPETELTAEYEDSVGTKHIVTLERQKRQGGVTLYPSFPDVFIADQQRELEGGIHYVSFNAFQPDSPARVLSAIDELNDPSPLILDLRGNNGGSANATEEILGRFARNRFLAFYRAGRNDTTAVFIEPHLSGHRGKVVVMVDELSISAAENFAAIMQREGLAQVVGTRSPGQLLWGEGFAVGDSLMAVIPVAEIVYPDGSNIEAKGVTPDFLVPLCRENLLLGIDTQLQAALRLFVDR